MLLRKAHERAAELKRVGERAVARARAAGTAAFYLSPSASEIIEEWPDGSRRLIKRSNRAQPTRAPKAPAAAKASQPRVASMTVRGTGSSPLA